MDHPTIIDFEPERILILLRRYEDYVLELLGRDQKISKSPKVSIEAVRSLSLTLAVDTVELEAVLCLGLIN